MIKTSKNNSSEACSIDKNKIILLGTEKLNTYYLKHNKFSPSYTDRINSFLSNFICGEDIFYSLKHLSSGQILYAEFGVATLREGYIERKYTLYGVYFKDNASVVDRPRIYLNQDNSEEEILEVSSYLPTTIPELLQSPNSIIVSNENGHAVSFELEDDSIVGSSDGEIKNIPISSLDISSITKSIKLKAHKLFCSIIEAKTFVIKKISKPKRPIIGSIIVDSDDGLLKYYDGKTWNVISCYEDT